MDAKKRLRLFLDSNILTGGLVSIWGLDRALLSLYAARICKMILAAAVRDELYTVARSVQQSTTPAA